MGVEIDIVYQGNLHCQATHGPSGSTLVTDAPVDNGGKGEVFSPTDLVATALGSCLLTIMGLVAKRNGLNVDGVSAHVTKEMAAAPVRRIGKLLCVVTVPNSAGISAEDRTKLEKGALACPVAQSLHPDTQVQIEFRYI